MPNEVDGIFEINFRKYFSKVRKFGDYLDDLLFVDSSFFNKANSFELNEIHLKF